MESVTMNTVYVAVGFNDYGDEWQYAFATESEAVQFIQAATAGYKWRIAEVEICTAEKAIADFLEWA